MSILCHLNPYHQGLTQKALTPDVTPKKFVEPTGSKVYKQQPLNPSERAKIEQASKEPLPPKIIAANPFESLVNTIDAGKRKLFEAVANIVKKIPGYKLLVLILGKDLFTGQAVKRNENNMASAVSDLIPGTDTIFKNLTESGAIKRAFKWFSQEFPRLKLTYENVKKLLQQSLNVLTPGDLINPGGAFQKVQNIFAPTRERITNFAKGFRNQIMEFAFEGFLGKAGKKGLDILKTLKKTYGVIFSNPEAFLKNLFKALQKGFISFKNNFLTIHLPNGLNKWLFGIVGGHLPIPVKLDFQAFFTIGLEVLGITYDNLRPKLATAVGGEKRLVMVEKIVKGTQQKTKIAESLQLLQRIIHGGLGGAWEQIKGYVVNFQKTQDDIIASIKDIVFKKVIAIAIPKLIAMFNPAFAAVEAVMTIYNSVMFFIQRFQEITELANAVLQSLNNIALGKGDDAPKYVENAMGRSVSIIIGFLAKLFKIDGIVEEIKKVIKRIQKSIKTAINKLVDLVANKINSFFKPNQGQKQPSPTNPKKKTTPAAGSNEQNQIKLNQETTVIAAKLKDGEIGETQKFSAGDEAHRLWIEVNKKKATVMVASEPTPLITLLNREDVNSLNNPKTDPKRHIEEARRICNQATHNSQAIITVLNQKKNQEAEKIDQEIEKEMLILVKHLKWIFEQLTKNLSNFLEKREQQEILSLQAAFGSKPFFKKDAMAILSLSPRAMTVKLKKWSTPDNNGNRILYTNSKDQKDPYKQYAFLESALLNRDEKTQASDSEKITYYQQVLTAAQVAKKDWPTTNKADNYRQEARDLVINKIGDNLALLNERIMRNPELRSKIPNQYNSLFGSIYEVWCDKYESTNQEKVIFNVDGHRRDADGWEEPDILVEKKSRKSGPFSREIEQMKIYFEIINKKIPGYTCTAEGSEEKYFNKVKYTFSDRPLPPDIKKKWRDALDKNLDGYYIVDMD